MAILASLLAALLLGSAHAAPVDELGHWLEHVPVVATPAAERGGYHSAREVYEALYLAARANPGRVAVERIGTTHSGTPIWAFHITNPATPGVERKVLIFAGLHAMEWIGTETALATALEFITHPPDHTLITVVPIANPDGRGKVEADLLAGENTWRRGNRINVDLNRDFAVNRDSDAVWAHVPIAKRYYYTSPGPLSQPESRALDALAARERYDRSASLHAYGGFFYYPWAGRFARPDDRYDFERLGRAMEGAQGGHAYNTKQLGRWLFAFRALGTEIDHLYGEYGTRAFLIELTRTGISPLKPWEWKDRFQRYNPEDREEHVERGWRALRALVLTDLEPA